MPSTVEQIASEALLNVASDAGAATAANFISQRYRKLASRVRFRHLRKRGTITMPAAVTTGLATFTQGSDLVVGNATALAAWQAVGSTAIQGRFIRPGSGGSQPWLEIAGLELGGLRLTAAFSGATLAASSYRIVARYHRLPTDVRWLGAVIFPRLNVKLKLSSESEAAEYSAGRLVVGSGYPTYYLLGPPAFDGHPRVEIYPPAGNQDEVVNFTYHAEPPLRLSLTEYIPHGLSEDVLRDGAVLDLLHLEWAKAVKAKDYEGAAHYRNEFHALRTIWDRDCVFQAGDVDTTVSDDFIMVRGAEWDREAGITEALESGLWPEQL